MKALQAELGVECRSEERISPLLSSLPRKRRAALNIPPASLSEKSLARTEWLRLAPELIEKGVLTTGDLVIFEQYCRLVGDVAEYEELVRTLGRPKAHRLGYVNYLLKLRAQLKQYAAELGLTPSSRSGVRAVKPKAANPVDAFFKADWHRKGH